MVLKINIRNIFRKARNPFKALKILVKGKLGWLGVPLIVPYTAYGNREKIFITGAVVEDKGLAKPEEGQKLWKNILAMVKRYSGDEIAGVRVRIEYNNRSEIVQTNEMGLFHTVLPSDDMTAGNNRWIPVKYTLIDEVIENQETVTADGEIHLANPDAEFYIISDIDDTVMISHSTRMWKKLRLMLFKNALTRSPFEGVSAFYRALVTGLDDTKRSIFYVSSSEWNLYDMLVDFFEIKNIPRGSLLLSNEKMKLFRIYRSGKRHQDKIERIKELFELYYRQNFILIGDSGQKDPEIYLKIAEMYPSRVKAIYIRYIGNRKKTRRIEALVDEAGELGTEMIAVHTTLEAAKHAVRHGYIKEDQVSEIFKEKKMEEDKPEL